MPDAHVLDTLKFFFNQSINQWMNQQSISRTAHPSLKHKMMRLNSFTKRITILILNDNLKLWEKMQTVSLYCLPELL